MDTRLTKIFLRCVSRFEGTFRKNCKIQSVDLLFLVVLRAFTSADIIFHKFLELQSTLSEKKKDFHQKVSFFNGFTQTLTPPTPKSGKPHKSFLSMLPNLSRFFKIIML